SIFSPPIVSEGFGRSRACLISASAASASLRIASSSRLFSIAAATALSAVIPAAGSRYFRYRVALVSVGASCDTPGDGKNIQRASAASAANGLNEFCPRLMIMQLQIFAPRADPFLMHQFRPVMARDRDRH